jgi:hypothetical protein
MRPLHVVRGRARQPDWHDGKQARRREIGTRRDLGERVVVFGRTPVRTYDI